MGTTSSINPGIANLLQTLSNVDGPVASSPGLVAALEKAPPSDIVQLSVAATQLQTVSSLFGGADDTSTANPFTAGTNNNDFTNLESILTGSSGPGSESAQAAAQLQNVDSLFGIADSTNTSSNFTDPVPPSGATAAQLAQYEALQQIQTTQSLFGTAGTNVLG